MSAAFSRARRDALRMLAAAPLLGALPAQAQAPSRKLTILVYLHGGNDGYNTWVPYTDPLYHRVRPTIAVPRDGVLRITDSHGFHPSLAALMPSWQARDLALLQGIGYPDSTQQHFRDTDTAFTGFEGREYAPDGWVTRALRKGVGSGDAIADALAFDMLDIRGSDPMGPFRGEGLAVVQVYHPSELLGFRRLADCSTVVNEAGRPRLGAAPLAPVALKTAFPTDPFGAAMRAAVELAALRRAPPVIHVALNGLDFDKHHSVDCHWEQLKYHGDALKRLAEGLAALRNGLIEIGRWDEALVATYDEFGRSPMENEDRGTHHGHASTHFVMGGGVKGGLYGKAPPVIEIYPRIGGPEPVIDTRELWTTVIEGWWSGSAAGVFPRRAAPLDLVRA